MTDTVSEVPEKDGTKVTTPEHESLGTVILTLEEAPLKDANGVIEWVTDFQGGQNLEEPW